MRIEIISNSSIFTKNLGKKLSRVISKGDIVLFSGELGGGKTTFISGIAEGFDLKENLSSPSFIILSEYSIDNWRKFIHADLYRLENTGEINGIGLDDYLYDDISIICIEWGDKIKDYIEKEYLEINLSYLIDKSNIPTKRKIIFNSSSQYWDLRLARFKKILEKSGE
ncbi:MAG: tRNA (adenosine(37)-N6)-threonylcarbamoyltransferase complex ATPase subunit type 1 TsaE [Actinobacteria bacterium]|nr:tRNA (adenosine(37)-N6)-threonylcarbamoyltransferase complex ATPase subunit type 1 TsaE [Actinomycetota bacterium]